MTVTRAENDVISDCGQAPGPGPTGPHARHRCGGFLGNPDALVTCGHSPRRRASGAAEAERWTLSDRLRKTAAANSLL